MVVVSEIANQQTKVNLNLYLPFRTLSPTQKLQQDNLMIIGILTTMQKLKVAIVGYGQFGRFMAKHLRPYCTIIPFKRDTNPAKISDCDIVIFAVPWGGLATAIENLKPHIQPTARIIDVMSVKQKPLALLQKNFKQHEILGTHPIFGPQSGKNGLTGLPIVLCNISFSKKHYTQIKQFLKKKLKLKIIEEAATAHDTEMSKVQGLTHFIGRALVAIEIESYATNTKSYEQLLQLKELLKNDSWELFATIQNTNPEAKKVRTRFITELIELESKLDSELAN